MPQSSEHTSMPSQEIIPVWFFLRFTNEVLNIWGHMVQRDEIRIFICGSLRSESLSAGLP